MDRVPRGHPGEQIRTPILVQEGGDFLDGLHRTDAARERGDATIPAIVVNLSPEDQSAAVYRANLNKIETFDPRAVVAARYAAVLADQGKSDRARKGGQARGWKGTGTGLTHSALHGGAEQVPGRPAVDRTPRATERAAALYGVSRKKVEKVATLLKEAPHLADQVLAGKKRFQNPRRPGRRGGTPPPAAAPGAIAGRK